MKKFVSIVIAIVLVASVVVMAETTTQPKFVKEFIAGFYQDGIHPEYHTILGWGTAEFLDGKTVVKLEWVSWMNSDGLIAIDFSKELTPAWTSDLLTVRDNLKRGWSVFFGTLYTTNCESFEMPDVEALQTQINHFKKFSWCKAMEIKEVLSDRTYKR